MRIPSPHPTAQRMQETFGSKTVANVLCWNQSHWGQQEEVAQTAQGSAVSLHEKEMLREQFP